MKKVYQGQYIDGNAVITVNEKPLKHIVRHSPTGFSWGYGGSGPADTALSVLTDLFGGFSDLADIFYLGFKWDFVAFWGEKWQIDESEIDKWLVSKTGKGINALIAERKQIKGGKDYDKETMATKARDTGKVSIAYQDRSENDGGDR